MKSIERLVIEILTLLNVCLFRGAVKFINPRTILTDGDIEKHRFFFI